MNKLSSSHLIKIASVGGVFVIGNALLMRFLAQRRFRQSPYFIQSRDILMGNRALVNFLGEPIGFGSIDLGNSENFSTPTECKFKIPLKGSNHEGTLHLWSVRTEEKKEDQSNNDNSSSSSNNTYSGWNVKNLEVTIKDKPNQKLILVEDSVLKKPQKSSSS